jgi:hypothetical protein
MMRVVMPTMVGLSIGMIPSALLKGVATDEELDATLGGMPHNVTTEMDLSLWGLAVNAREHRDEVRRHGAFTHLARAEIHRGRKVEQEPGGNLAVLVVLAHVGRLQPRGDVPVDVAHVVAVLVLAQIGEVQAEAAKQRAIVAVQDAVKTANHRPFEPLKDTFRIIFQFRHEFAWVCQVRVHFL